MADLTVLIITKNEEKNLAKCVASFRGCARRFVVVDSYSTDGTKELCGQLDAELRTKGSCLDFYEHPFENHAAQINWGLDNADIKTAWVMRIDADEELTPELAEELEKRLDTLPEQVSGVILKRRLIFMGRWIRHGGRYPEYLLRIFRNGLGRCEQRIMDEHIKVESGETVTFAYDFIDNNQKDLEWWTAKHNWYSNREVMDHARQLEGGIDSITEGGEASAQAVRKRKIKDGGYYRLPKFFRAHIYFLYRYYIRLGFLDGPEGRIFHFLQAYWYRFLVDAKMYQYEKTGKEFQAEGDLKG